MEPKTKSRMLVMLVSLGILFAIVFGWKLFTKVMIGRWIAAHGNPVMTVSVAQVNTADWQPQLKASGSLRAVLGVNVTTQRAGLIKNINFKPGANVKKGDVLVELDTDADVAQLHVFEAQAALALVTYNRDKAQYAFNAVSKATLDTDEANLKSSNAQVEQQKAIIQQKTVVAPFDGRLGISSVNPGQYLNPGDKVTMLQTLNPIYVDFFVPQQLLNEVKVGEKVTMVVDSSPHKTFTGQITTVDPGVDSSVRNVQVEATFENPNEELTPGAFATVTVDTGAPKTYLILPQTAISFNPYGETVFIVKDSGERDKDGQPVLTVTQTFVKTGEKRGDMIAVLSGIKKGDKVVTSGQLKLKNGSRIAINNSVLPINELAPTPVDET